MEAEQMKAWFGSTVYAMACAVQPGPKVKEHFMTRKAKAVCLELGLCYERIIDRTSLDRPLGEGGWGNGRCLRTDGGRREERKRLVVALRAMGCSGPEIAIGVGGTNHSQIYDMLEEVPGKERTRQNAKGNNRRKNKS